MIFKDFDVIFNYNFIAPFVLGWIFGDTFGPTGCFPCKLCRLNMKQHILLRTIIWKSSLNICWALLQISITGNPWVCDESLSWMRVGQEPGKLFSNEYISVVTLSTPAMCALPLELKGQNLAYLGNALLLNSTGWINRQLQLTYFSSNVIKPCALDLPTRQFRCTYWINVYI